MTSRYRSSILALMQNLAPAWCLSNFSFPNSSLSNVHGITEPADFIMGVKPVHH